VKELNANLAICALNSLEDFKFVYSARNLWDCESRVCRFFECFVLGRWWSNVVKDTLVDGKVHEFNTKLTLNLVLLLNGVLNDHTHLLNSVHLSLLRHEDPILEHLIEVKRALAHFFQLR